jgi:hypothetical protein
MGITDEEYRSIGVDPREYVVPEWYKEKLHAEGWTPCPDEEKCGHCGRFVQYGGEMCCGHHLEENKLIARDDDDSLYYPIPTRMDYLERVEFLDGVITETAAAMKVSGDVNWLLKHLPQFVLTVQTKLSEMKVERKQLDKAIAGAAEVFDSLESGMRGCTASSVAGMAAWRKIHQRTLWLR